MAYEIVIGLETHTQLSTQTKIFSGSSTRYGAQPNTQANEVDMALPGTLPVMNRVAVEHAIRLGLAVGATIAPRSIFARKNYFYPDLPKNYHISQYEIPVVLGGSITFFVGDKETTINLTRAHLEEDVGKNVHFDRHSGVDFNRAGVPLLEIVSEPDITSADMAHAYLNALVEVLVRGGISDCDMEKGMLRCDVNVSVRPKGSTTLGAKIEIKNMNTFSGVRRALDYEIPRQIEAVRRGEKLRQETRRWDDVAGITEPMRSKEDAHDYRYFPDPDLLPFTPSDAWVESIRQTVPEMPLARKQRLIRDFNLPAGDAEVLKSNPDLGHFFEQAATGYRNPKAIANWVINNLPAQLAAAGSSIADLRFSPAHLRDLADLVDSGRISTKIAQDVFSDMFATGEAPAAIVDRKGLAQVSDTAAIEKICDDVIAANPSPAADFKAGKIAALNFLKGQVMKLSKGKANPGMAGDILARKLQ